MLGAMLAAATLVACDSSAPAAGSGTGGSLAGSAKPSSAASASPSFSAAPAPLNVDLSVTAPKEGATLPIGDVTVTYDITGVTLVPAADAKKLDDYHLHVFLDVDPTPYLQQFKPVPTGDDRVVHTAAKSV